MCPHALFLQAQSQLLYGLQKLGMGDNDISAIQLLP